MSNYKSLIDEAMKTARYRLEGGVTKEASVSTESSLVKEASELANALEYMSISANNDGSVAGQARAEIVRDFYKAATAQRLGVKLAGDVGEGSTSASGMQAFPPQQGKVKLQVSKDQNGNPLVSSSPDSRGKTMLESYKQAHGVGTTLYDILMHEKEAGDVGEYDSEQYMSITGANENSNRSILNDSSILRGVSKQEAKAPVRDRLKEAFSTTSDTLGDQTVRAMFPTAYQRGGLKKTANKVPSFSEYDRSRKAVEAGMGQNPVVKRQNTALVKRQNTALVKRQNTALVPVTKTKTKTKKAFSELPGTWSGKSMGAPPPKGSKAYKMALALGLIGVGSAITYKSLKKEAAETAYRTPGKVDLEFLTSDRPAPITFKVPPASERKLIHIPRKVTPVTTTDGGDGGKPPKGPRKVLTAEPPKSSKSPKSPMLQSSNLSSTPAQKSTAPKKGSNKYLLALLAAGAITAAEYERRRRKNKGK